MRPVKLAIAGCGVVTDDCHLPAALRSSGVEVAALVDSSLERAALLARKYGCASAEISATLGAVLSRVEAVLIATPNHTHAALARIALDQGIPVLVEKPLTTSHADAVELCELASRKGTLLSVGFFTRHYPVVQLMRRLLNEGFLGRPERFHFEYGTAGGWAPLSGYNLDRKQSGGGVLVVNGTHFLDRMLYWFGEPERFTFADDSYGGVEANCKASLEFRGGLRGTLFFSKTIDLKNTFTFYTERYTVELPWAESEKLTLTLRSLPGTQMLLRNTDRPACSDYFQAQIEEFARIIREGGSPSVDGETGARCVKLCEAFYAGRTQLEEPWAWYRHATVGQPT